MNAAGSMHKSEKSLYSTAENAVQIKYKINQKVTHMCKLFTLTTWTTLPHSEPPGHFQSQPATSVKKKQRRHIAKKMICCFEFG